ncbi:MAG TPA: cofactor-independent phosphoglycerate mutase [bacterium]|nr:cofactor-independent phosphoglycerate mutase [bacterium]
MKYVVILPDGMADNRYLELSNKSPVEYADTPTFDFIARHGILGQVKTIPDELPSGSDVAIMSVMGYDPRKYYMARGPLEAVSLNIPFTEHDIIFRFNLITIEDNRMESSNAYHIKTEEARKIIDYFNKSMYFDGIKFFAGTGYRHIMLIDSRKYPELDYLDLQCTPPHDIVNQLIEYYLPRGKGEDLIRHIMWFSNEILEKYKKQNPKSRANLFWPWGQGKIKKIAKFSEKYGIDGSVISAVDLIKGLGAFVGLEVIEVPGATGYYDSNFEGKTAAALAALKNKDFVFVHIEATDEAGHDGNLQKKIEMIEIVDKVIAAPILDFLKNNYDDFRIMVLPDHPTPITLRTHENKPVPFAIYDNRRKIESNKIYSEFAEIPQKYFIQDGYSLMEKFINHIDYFF